MFKYVCTRIFQDLINAQKQQNHKDLELTRMFAVLFWNFPSFVQRVRKTEINPRHLFQGYVFDTEKLVGSV